MGTTQNGGVSRAGRCFWSMVVFFVDIIGLRWLNQTYKKFKRLLLYSSCCFDNRGFEAVALLF